MLVSFQIDEQRPYAMENLRFFLTFGVTFQEGVRYAVVINGPCSYSLCNPVPGEREGRVLVVRRENRGFDFGAHAAVLRSVARDGELPRFFIGINCGARGPFLPAWAPEGWHWTRAFVERMGGPTDVRLVGTSIVCLPRDDFCAQLDDRCFGPKVEGFAFAIEREALAAALNAGAAFDGGAADKHAAVLAEYALSRAVLDGGWNIGALLMAYDGVDFREASTWDCNAHRFPTRAGKYFGISVSPLETVFHKSFWGKAEEPRVMAREEERYTQWRYERLARSLPGLAAFLERNDEEILAILQARRGPKPGPHRASDARDAPDAPDARLLHRIVAARFDRRAAEP